MHIGAAVYLVQCCRCFREKSKQNRTWTIPWKLGLCDVCMENGVYGPPEYTTKGWGYIMLRISIGGLPRQHEILLWRLHYSGRRNRGIGLRGIMDISGK